MVSQQSHARNKKKKKKRCPRALGLTISTSFAKTPLARSVERARVGNQPFIMAGKESCAQDDRRQLFDEFRDRVHARVGAVEYRTEKVGPLSTKI